MGYTRVVYELFRDSRYEEAVGFLGDQLQLNPSSRPALSLLAYAHYRYSIWVPDLEDEDSSEQLKNHCYRAIFQTSGLRQRRELL